MRYPKESGNTDLINNIKEYHNKRSAKEEHKKRAIGCNQIKTHTFQIVSKRWQQQ